MGGGKEDGRCISEGEGKGGCGIGGCGEVVVQGDRRSWGRVRRRMGKRVEESDLCNVVITGPRK